MEKVVRLKGIRDMQRTVDAIAIASGAILGALPDPGRSRAIEHLQALASRLSTEAPELAFALDAIIETAEAVGPKQR